MGVSSSRLHVTSCLKFFLVFHILFTPSDGQIKEMQDVLDFRKEIEDHPG